MRDSVWAGNVQKLVYPDGTPKDAEAILKERGFIDTSKLKLDLYNERNPSKPC